MQFASHLIWAYQKFLWSGIQWLNFEECETSKQRSWSTAINDFGTLMPVFITFYWQSFPNCAIARISNFSNESVKKRYRACRRRYFISLSWCRVGCKIFAFRRLQNTHQDLRENLLGVYHIHSILFKVNVFSEEQSMENFWCSGCSNGRVTKLIKLVRLRTRNHRYLQIQAKPLLLAYRGWHKLIVGMITVYIYHEAFLFFLFWNLLRSVWKIYHQKRTFDWFF